jgi:hypothetical protein
MTVQELIAVLQTHKPDALAVDDEGLALRAGDVLPVQMRKVPGTPAWGDQGAARYAVDDDGDVAGVSIG